MIGRAPDSAPAQERPQRPARSPISPPLPIAAAALLRRCTTAARPSRFPGEDELPEYPDTQLLPMNGKFVNVVKPPKPVAPPEPTGPKLDQYGMPIDDEDTGETVEKIITWLDERKLI